MVRANVVYCSDYSYRVTNFRADNETFSFTNAVNFKNSSNESIV